ncbi:MAG: hypothetical protein Q9190_003285 [Brigantiaea leucoxantha]
MLLHLFLLIDLVSGDGQPSDNGTVTRESDGTPLYCDKTSWYDVLWFFFSNYLLHALSVRSLPGENSVSSTVFKLCCFLIPFTGIRRGLGLILRASNLAPNDLQAAARANALCMVIRKPEWRPKDGDEIAGCQLDIAEPAHGTTSVQEFGTVDIEQQSVVKSSALGKSESAGTSCEATRTEAGEIVLKTRDLYEPPGSCNLIDRITRSVVQSYRFDSHAPSANILDVENVKLHGLCRLAQGYCLAYVPMDMKIYSRTRFRRRLSFAGVLGVDNAPEIKLASTYDIPRILFSLIQTGSAGYALYRARGAQIDRFGCAAFGLTVLPYMVVSVVNLIGSLLTSEYETMYLVHSAMMDEMNNKGGICDGVVGSIEDPDSDDIRSLDGEEKTKLRGLPMLFDGPNEALRFHEASQPVSSTSRALAVLNWMDKPKVRGYWIGRYCLSKFHKSKHQPQPPKATLSVPSHSSFTRLSQPWYQTYLNLLTIVLLLLSFTLPYLIITLLTGWKKNRSTSTARTLTLNWLICGQLQGYAVGGVERLTGRVSAVKALVIVFLIYGSYTVGGLVTVAQEMIQFGLCKAL